MSFTASIYPLDHARPPLTGKDAARLRMEHRVIMPESDPETLTASEWTSLREKERLRGIFAAAFARSRRSIEDLYPSILLTVWRITREMARLRGLIAPDEAFADLADFRDDIWTLPRPFIPDGTRRNITSVTTQAIAEAILRAEEEVEAKFSPTPNHPGIALQPPAVADIFMEGDQPSEHYDPHEDPLLLAFIKVVDATARALDVRAGSQIEPEYGRDALQALLSPDLIRLAWPAPTTIMAFELHLIEQTLDKLVKDNNRKVERWLETRYGLSRPERASLMKMAKKMALDSVRTDAEEDRSLMTLRLQDLANRAKEACDLRAELGALKQMTIVLGLARVDPMDIMTDIVHILGDAAKERAQLREENRKALPHGTQGEVIDAEFTVED